MALLVLLSLSSQAQDIIGVLPSNNYPAKEYKTDAQNWKITQSPSGIIYVANNLGLLEYDFNEWVFRTTASKSNIRDILYDDNRIYFSAKNDFGYFESNEQGVLIRHDLANKTEEKNFGEVWSVNKADNKYYYQTDHTLFIWDGEKLSHVKAESEIKRVSVVADEVFLKLTNNGIAKVNNGKIEPLGMHFNVPIEEVEFEALFKIHDKLTALSRTRGLFQITRKGDSTLFRPLSKRTNEVLSKVRATGIEQISENVWSISTWGNGLILIDGQGRIKGKIGKENGLFNTIIQDQHIDHQGILWLATSNGISNIDILSAVSSFDESNGYVGTIESVANYNDHVIFGTHTGIFFYDSTLTQKKYFRKIKNFDDECWGLTTVKVADENKLLAIGTSGLFEYSTASGRFAYQIKCDPYSLVTSTKYENTVIVGTSTGINIITKKGLRWKSVKQIKFGDVVHNIQQDQNGNLLLGMYEKGVAFVSGDYRSNDTLDYQVKNINHEQGLRKESFTVPLITQDQLFLVGTDSGIFVLDHANFEATPYEPMNSNFSKQYSIHRLSEDNEGNIWTVKFEDIHMAFGYFSQEKNKMFKWHYEDFVGINDEIIHAMMHKPNTTWYGGSNGLFKFEANHYKNFHDRFVVNVRNFTAGDSTLYGGHPHESIIEANENEINYLDYEFNSVGFAFAANYYQKEKMMYSWQLVGHDKAWTSWSKLHKTNYTNLSPGSYTFKVRAKNELGDTSTIRSIEFEINPPWYQTIWAYVLYLVLFAAVIYIAIVISSKGLKAIIEEKTAEITLQKEEIEKKNSTLEQANEEIEAKNANLEQANEEIIEQKDIIEEKNKDIMDSINYAERIQRAMLPTESAQSRLFDKSFVLFMPKDVVSGDFFWMAQKDGKSFFTAADCTGHGVPGALMSMIGASLFNQTINASGIISPGQILDGVRNGIIERLKQGTETDSKDGMDAALCAINFETNVLEFSGANNPLYIVRPKTNEILASADGEDMEENLVISNDNHDLYEIKADKMPIGYHIEMPPFTTHRIQLKKGDTVYSFSDGYPDQFGGPKGKKFMYKRFKRVLLDLQDNAITEREQILRDDIESWMQGLEQIDDICIIGVEI